MKSNEHGEYEVALIPKAGLDPMLYAMKRDGCIDLSTGRDRSSNSTWFASLTEEHALRLIFVLRRLTKDARAARKKAKKVSP
jgi:hypothetical protein